MIEVLHTLGTARCTSADELRAALSARTPEGTNELHLSRGEAAPHPLLMVHVNGTRAYLHCFLVPNHPGHQVFVADAPPGETFFPGDYQLEMPNYTVVDVDRAMAVAEAFLRDPTRLPEGVDWAEL